MGVQRGSQPRLPASPEPPLPQQQEALPEETEVVVEDAGPADVAEVGRRVRGGGSMVGWGGGPYVWGRGPTCTWGHLRLLR